MPADPVPVPERAGETRTATEREVRAREIRRERRGEYGDPRLWEIVRRGDPRLWPFLGYRRSTLRGD